MKTVETTQMSPDFAVTLGLIDSGQTYTDEEYELLERWHKDNLS